MGKIYMDDALTGLSFVVGLSGIARCTMLFSPRKQTWVQKNAGKEDLSSLIIYPSSALSAFPS